MSITRNIVAALAISMLAMDAFAALPKEQVKKLNEAAAVVAKVRSSPEGIPEDIWSKAACVVVIPSLKKAGFIIAGEFGSGAMSCRNAGHWGAPVFMKLTKGSAGFQAGAQSTDLILVVLNRKGAEKLLGNEVTLGADASIAAGPAGRTATAGTDAQMTAEILSYSHAKGLFAGVDLSGGSLRADDKANTSAYGSNASAKDIALGNTPATVPPEARAFIDTLGREMVGTSGVK
jgi:lipid-binding SYLF domain-containing protein